MNSGRYILSQLLDLGDRKSLFPVGSALRCREQGSAYWGAPMEVLRIERNGVEAFGFFLSTPVVEIREDGLIETYNSIYRIIYPSNSGKEVV